MIRIKLVSELSELEGIKTLQEENLKKNLTVEEAEAQGFVTAEYSINFLQTLHEQSPSVIAIDGNKVVGYALVALKSIRHQHDLLSDLFGSIDKIEYSNRLLKYSNYVVVGQLCVAKDYRGQGLVQQMYQQFKTSLFLKFDYCLTDIAENNPRSLKSHLKTGFRIVDTLHYGGIDWNIVLWDWNAK
jgi:ribosomal protein S18 acetylase RimI-like enzyme